MSELPSRPTARILRAEDAALWSDGFAFLQAAKAQAEQIKADSDQWLQAARAEGFESARQEGAEHVAQLLVHTQSQVQQYLSSLEASLADLALGIVREVLGDLDSADRVARCTRQALSAFRQDQALTLWVPPAEVDALRQRLTLEGLAIAVAADEQLGAGQARLSSPAGSVELGVEAQLQTLRRSLLPFAEEGVT
ncbi:type III secretion system stator protein SctL [Pseudomonas fluorescens]|jgi:type III secretion protein L|uniref:type III secretion system stator protein SctL n=1 Tax=Pseudomonas fluorescens TaxID=294 RepID=UPI0021D381AD|nr:type III secretion system stator protein SctL [Pseudomonas fluorescens]UXV17635.1 type III secretion system stator protein SctL [Pseudomonas fluorescens]